MSLQWILALTLTLTWLHCLITMPTSSEYTKEAFRMISNLQNITCNQSDSMFYSPSGEENIIQALNCSIQELKTVRAECFGNNSGSAVQHARRLSDLIGRMLKHSKQNSSTHWSCERSKIEPYHRFLKNVQTLIQRLNSRE